jgi:hypothetical protein
MFLIIALIGLVFLSQFNMRDGNEALAARIGNQAARVIKQPDVWTFEFMPISHLGIPI